MTAANHRAEKRGYAVKLGTAGLLAGILLLTLTTERTAEAAPNPLPKQEQADVNQAINKGVIYLRTHMNPRIVGTWSPNASYTVGYAALPGLTLLECGIPAHDRQVMAAAQHVRVAINQGKVDRTYEIALSILFLDRLIQAQPASAQSTEDRKLIHTLAAKLMAGQTSSGGWGYKCPDLTPLQTRDMLIYLHQLTPPRPKMETVVRDPKDPRYSNPNDPTLPVERDPSKPGEITQGSYPTTLGLPRPGFCIKMGDDWKPEKPEPKAVVEVKPPPEKPADPVKPPPKVNLPPHFVNLPVFRDPLMPPQADPGGNHNTPGVTDNSNSQFAILALWAAGRHGVPMDRSLNLVVKRFRTSQNGDGRWGYRYSMGGGAGGSEAMTAVGLLGLAVGHGIALTPDAKERAADDEMMKKGFLALHRMIGQPQNRMRDIPMANLYFLWSVERVAVLYDMPTILDKDWYRWGAEILVANQTADGSWNSEKYPGHSPPIDTCLALLFLKRANLARDLTRQLPYSPGDLNQELIARLPTEPKPTKVTPPERPELDSIQEPEPFVGPIRPTNLPETTDGIDRPTEDSASKPATSKQEEETQEAKPGFNRLWIFGLGFGVLLLIFGAVALFVMSRSSDDDEKKRRPHRRKVRKPTNL